MCGVGGLLRFDGAPVDPRSIDRLTRALAHRGPDDQGQYVDGPVGIAHTRLAVIDPRGGAQPFFSDDRRAALSYNGELYNFAELRAELHGLGHRFRTASDTEVVLHSWLEWGEACVRRFRGMFAFAVVDWTRRCLFLARDHFGIKPLVYYRAGAEFGFASELRALRGLPDCPSELDLQALDDYLALSYVPAPRTIFSGVHKLPPAHTLVAHFDGRVEPPQRYWDLDFRAKRRRRERDWQRDLEETLRASVRAHMISDVPLGALLSGGVDSSLLVSLMAEESDRPLATFSAGFRGAAVDESRHAQVVRDRWGTRHQEAWIESDAREILPQLVERHGEPFGDWSSLPFFYLAEAARARVPVVLSGDGADEAFAGYERHSQHHRSAIRRLASALRGRFGGVRARDRERPESWEDHCMMVLRAEARRRLWRPELRPEARDGLRPSAVVARRARGLGALDRARSVDYQQLLPDGILTKVDIASMAHGLEVRTPFLDREVVELAAAMPEWLLLARPRGDRVIAKQPLRKLLGRWFSSDFVNRPKQGFVPPVADWLRPPHAFRREVESLLLARGARVAHYFEPRAIHDLFDDFDRGGDAEPLWLLTVLEHWLRSSVGR